MRPDPSCLEKNKDKSLTTYAICYEFKEGCLQRQGK